MRGVTRACCPSRWCSSSRRRPRTWPAWGCTGHRSARTCSPTQSPMADRRFEPVTHNMFPCSRVSIDLTHLNIVACLWNYSLQSEDYFKLLALQSLRRHGPQRRGLVYPEQIKKINLHPQPRQCHRSPVGQHDGPVHLEEVLRAVEVCPEADGEEVVRDDLALLRPRRAHHVGGDVGLWAENG